ncbi:MAG: adenylosuccinate lyase, partial [Chthoniobacterales bacterium]
PHKRNPITGERLSGLARIIRGNAVAALENVPLWHERDISHSSVERIIFPDSCTLMDYMLVTLTKLIDKLIVYPENMFRNLEITLGLYFSQSVLLELTKKGMDRKDAYEAVQRAAMKTWKDKIPLIDNLKIEPEITKHMTAREISEACSLERHFRFVDEKFKALGIE